jgi:RNA polymerase sigma-70 factor (ECF subfamily)
MEKMKKDPKESRDYLLIQAARNNNDQQAYQELMDKHYLDVYLEIYTRLRDEQLSKDLAQEVMTKAFAQLDRYEPVFAFGTWLKRVTINHTIDFLRKKRLQTTSIDESYDYDSGEVKLQVEATDLTPEERLQKTERAAIVREYVGKLKDVYRNLIEMRYFDELSYEEMADALGIPLGTVKARLHRAKGMLNQMMISGQGQF